MAVLANDKEGDEGKRDEVAKKKPSSDPVDKISDQKLSKPTMETADKAMLRSASPRDYLRLRESRRLASPSPIDYSHGEKGREGTKTMVLILGLIVVGVVAIGAIIWRFVL